MIKAFLNAVFFLSILASLTAPACHGQTRPVESPKLTTDKLQEPPMQEAPWSLTGNWNDQKLWSATATLFKQGLADPRGSDYREIWLRVGDGWRGDVGLHRYHGWVLPASADFKQRFAICWNGLVYPVEKIGETPDLARDVRHSQFRDDEAISWREYHRSDFEMPGLQSLKAQPTEHSAVCGRYAWPIRVCLLLRLGETELAYRIWQQWQASWPGQPDPYLVLATQFEKGMYDAAKSAQMRGDDHLALIFAQTVTELKQPVNEEIKKQKLPAIPDRDEFLLNATALVADCKTRIAQLPHLSALQWGEHAFANKKEWARALSADLNEFAEWHTGNDYWEDPLYKALIRCGDDAVDPLLDSLEHGNQLTRSGNGERVADVANLLLNQIIDPGYGDLALPNSRPDFSTADDRSLYARVLGDYWKKFRGVSPAERRLEMLSDDHAPPEQWLRAANWIVELDGSQKRRLQGELLREKANPSVTELLQKRIDGLNQNDDADDEAAHARAEAAVSLTFALALWDGKSAIKPLNAELEHCQQTSGMSQHLPGIAEELARLGDRSRLSIYADWISSYHRPSDANFTVQVFAPLWMFPDDPSIARAAEKLFNGPTSEWNPLGVFADSYNKPLAASPLLAVDSFRNQLLRALANQSPCGTITIGSNLETKSEGLVDPYGRVEIPSAATHVAPANVPQTIRRCDYVAEQLALFGGAPEIQCYWPQADRDAAIKAVAEFLRKYSGNLKDTDAYLHNEPIDEREHDFHLSFPLLDHPATQAEANAHKAIFSLEGQGEHRQVKMPWPLPLKATWTGNRKYPIDQFVSGTKSFIEHNYVQECWIWQAEELKVDGKWLRYYGVVGPHEVEKVKGEEIEFLSSVIPVMRLTGGLDGGWPTIGPQEAQGPSTDLKAADDHLPVVLGFSNRTAVPVSMPTWLIRKVGDTTTIRPGVVLSLKWIGEAGVEDEDRDPSFGYPFPLKPLKLMPTESANEARELDLLQEGQIKPFDLRDCFDITQPGVYRLQIRFTKDSGLGEGESPAVEFELK
jgi:hypothetical protein